MSREIELKLELAPQDGRRLLEQPWLAARECKSERQVSVYYDSDSKVLRKNGYSLRVRTAGRRVIQTLKSLDSGAGLFVRGEWEHDIDGPEPDLARLERTPVATLELEHLKPIIRSEVTRTACRLLHGDAEIEIDRDDGMMSGEGWDSSISELEIELVRGEPDAALSLARRIAAEVPVKLGVMSKAERGFALADGALAKPIKAEAVAVRPEMTVGEGFETIVGACVRHFRLNEPLIIDNRQVEALHQARVAMRRLRSAFTLFGPAVRDEEGSRIRIELRWFTGELGEARNLDVYLQRKLEPDERRALQRKREAAYDAVAAAMDSRRFRTLMIDLIGWAALGEWRAAPIARKPLEPFVNRQMNKLWAKISRVRTLSRMQDQDRHRLRIQVKKLRYAVEFVELLHAHARERQKRFAKALEDLQEELGHLNDIVVAHSFAGAEPWLLNLRSRFGEERRHLRAAKQALRELRDIGPYWSS